MVTYGGELLYLWIWSDHSARSMQIIAAARFTMRWPTCVCDLNPRVKSNTCLMDLLGRLSYEKNLEVQ